MLITLTNQLNAISVWQESNVWRWENQSNVIADVPTADIITASKTLRLSEIRTEAAILIESKWPVWRQNNCALGVYPDTVVTECADDIASVIAASNTAEDSVEAATTVTEVEAVTPAWPVL